MVLQLKIINCKILKEKEIFNYFVFYRLLMDSHPNEQGESHVINEFNLETRQWESSHDVKQSFDREE